ncbi:MAG TPA: murein L,D-transpeptidase catalytic domain family protein [Chitinophagaceae bacterium]|nr:murein L,D-transpeptidase catalytic domain family protein [Chitinophagaceae bacterium]
MKEPLKTLSLISISLFISLLHLSFGNKHSDAASLAMKGVMGSAKHIASGKSVYDSLQLNLSGLSREAFDNAKKGWEKLSGEGKLNNQSVIAIVDFSQPSTKKRLYVLDMENYKVLFNTLVAHGRNSGKEWAKSFSNKLSSFKSSPGFYITGQTYTGSNGYSLKLTGIENGINDKAMQRAIVMHGADYVNESFIASRGYIGRSQGCPAVPLKDAKSIINTLKDGSCLYIYVPDQKYLSRSVMLNDSITGA